MKNDVYNPMPTDTLPKTSDILSGTPEVLTATSNVLKSFGDIVQNCNNTKVTLQKDMLQHELDMQIQHDSFALEMDFQQKNFEQLKFEGQASFQLTMSALNMEDFSSDEKMKLFEEFHEASEKRIQTIKKS